MLIGKLSQIKRLGTPKRHILVSRLYDAWRNNIDLFSPNKSLTK